MKLIAGLKSLTVNTLISEPEREGPSWFYPIATSMNGDREEADASFASHVRSAYKSNGIVFACITARQMPFSEARFQYQRMERSRPGDLWGDRSLSILETPWPNGTTGELLSRMEQDASLAGNFYATMVKGRIRRMRPDWVTILSGIKGDPDGDPFDLDAEVLGYIYEPTGRGYPSKSVLLTPDRVVHYSPLPDPDAQWRGMSWLTPILNEIEADTHATRHKLKFFQNGATLGTVISYDKSLPAEKFQQYVSKFKELHVGTDNAYKALHIGGGADAKVVGADLKQIDFRATQGAGETRIAAAAGVGAIIARFSEGLAGSSLNSGNYSAAKRQFADMTLRPLWRTAAASLAKLVTVPGDNRLWYDDRDIAFLKEDVKDAAEITAMQATTIRTLTDAGYTPDSVVAAIQNGDFTRLKHSGLYSVQLQKPGTADPTVA